MNTSSIYRPDTEEQLLDIMQWALSSETALDISGLGTKQTIGHPLQAKHQGLSMAGFSGITLYEGEELVMSAKAGTPLSDIQAALDEGNQEIACDIPNYTRLLKVADKDAPADQLAGTLAGAVACNFSGPKRIRFGAMRDHVLGFQALTGRGEIIKSGGRVVKNVTGYDLSKLFSGSWGTFGIMTDITVKTLPRAEKSRTILIAGVSREDSARVMQMALSSPYDVSAACWIPANLAQNSEVSLVQSAGENLVAIAIDGFAVSVADRMESLKKRLGQFGSIEELHSHNSKRFWREIRDVLPFAGEDDDRWVWKISTPPASTHQFLESLPAWDQMDVYMDWGGGLIWLAMNPRGPREAEILREKLAHYGGHAALIRANERNRGELPVFQPLSTVEAKLSASIRSGFDPKNLLNPGRFQPVEGNHADQSASLAQMKGT